MNFSVARFVLNVSLVFSFCSATMLSHLYAADLLVADLNGDSIGQSGVGRILAFDADTKAYKGEVITGLFLPSAMTLGPNGYLYVAERNTSRILTYDPNDNYAFKGEFATMASGIFFPGGLLYDGTSMYVSQLSSNPLAPNPFNGNLVWKLNSSGAVVDTIGAGTSETGRAGLALDNAGNLYVSDLDFGAGGSSIWKFDGPDFQTNSSTSSQTMAFGTNQILFHDGGLYVTGLFAGTVVRFDFDNGTLSNPAPIAFGLSFPGGLMLGSDNNLLITEIGPGNDAPGTPGKVVSYDFSSGQVTDFILPDDIVDANDPNYANFWPVAVTVVPEPMAISLIASGAALLVGCHFIRRRRN